MDILDKNVLGYLVQCGPLTTAELVEHIFEWTDRYDRHKKMSKLRFHLERMSGEGLISRDKNKKYTLSECVIFDESTLSLHTNAGDIRLDTGPVIMFERPDGDFLLVLLDQP